MVGRERLCQERVLAQVDLSHGQVVGGLPVALQPGNRFVRKRLVRGLGRRGVWSLTTAVDNLASNANMAFSL